MEGDELFDDLTDEEDWTDTSWSNEQGCKVSMETQKTAKSSNLKDVYKSSIQKEDLVKDINKNDDNLMSRMKLNDNKAGMEGIDKERINQIILEASKGSKFYENERKKEEQVRKRIQEQQEKLEKITEVQLSQGLVQADLMLEEFERARELSHTIVHIDMDAFYAAVEIRDKPELKDKPMAVGGNSMLSTSNYHARKYGVRAAMPGFIGKKLCPDLVIVPTNFEKYTNVSKQVKEIMADYDPNFCPMSLDEAYLDITEHLQKRQMLTDKERTYLCRKCDNLDVNFCLCDLNQRLRDEVILSGKGSAISTTETVVNEETLKNSDTDFIGSVECSNKRNICPVCGKPFPDYDSVVFGTSPDDSVMEMRSRIEQKTRLTASAGIAPNMMLAKVCSDRNKPNGQYRILPTVEAVMDFIKDLPIRKISGIGKISEQMLNAIGVVNCTDLHNQRALLYHLYSQISFNYFMRICLGIGSTTVERDSDRKSISTERTFREISKPSDLYNKCYELCEALSEDLVEERLKGKTVTIKLKTVKFEVKTRAHTLPEHTSDVETIFASAKDLLKTEIQSVAPSPLRLRLMGVRMSSLLNQSLCKNKQKQRTISGLIKKLESKTTQNRTVHDSNSEHTENMCGKTTQNRTVYYGNSEHVENVSYETTQNRTVYDLNSEHTENMYGKTTQNRTVYYGNSEQVENVSGKTTQNRAVCDGNSENVEKVLDRVPKPSKNVSGVFPKPISDASPEHKIHVSDFLSEDRIVFYPEPKEINRTGLVSESSTGEDNVLSEPDLNKTPWHKNMSGTLSSTDVDLKINEMKKPDIPNKRAESLMTVTDGDFSSENSFVSKATSSVSKTTSSVSKATSSVSKATSSVSKTTSSAEVENSEEDPNKKEISSTKVLPCLVPMDLEKSDKEVENKITQCKSGEEKFNLDKEILITESESEKDSMYECPICGNDVKCENLSTFNQHIDICLNKKIVMDCSRNENLRASQDCSKQPGKSSQSKNSKSSPLSSAKKKQKSVKLNSPLSLSEKKKRNTKQSTKMTGLKSRTLNLTPNVEMNVSEDVETVGGASRSSTLDAESETTDSCLSHSMLNEEACTQNESRIKAEIPVTKNTLSLNDAKLVCPVCFMEQSRKSLDDFNTHVDSCLSKGTISDILKEQKHCYSGKISCKRSSIDVGDQHTSGKRKRSISGHLNKNSVQSKVRNIDSFFRT